MTDLDFIYDRGDQETFICLSASLGVSLSSPGILQAGVGYQVLGQEGAGTCV